MLKKFRTVWFIFLLQGKRVKEHSSVHCCFSALIYTPFYPLIPNILITQVYLSLSRAPESKCFFKFCHREEDLGCLDFFSRCFFCIVSQVFCPSTSSKKEIFLSIPFKTVSSFALKCNNKVYFLTHKCEIFPYLSFPFFWGGLHWSLNSDIPVKTPQCMCACMCVEVRVWFRTHNS